MRDHTIETRTSLNMLGVWSAIVYILMILLGWGLVAGFVPPLKPSASAAETAAVFAGHTIRIRIGMVIVMFSALSYIPFGAVLTRYVRKVEGGAGVLTFTVLLGGVGNMVLSFLPGMIWLIAAFRPNRDPEVLQLANDAGWLFFVGGVSMIMALPLGLALAAFYDRSPEPIFPRWFGYLNVWIFLVIMPDQLLFFFQSGPFAYNGIFGLWIPVTAFAVFFIAGFIVLRRAVLREHEEMSRASAAPVHA
jgi:hypothetical protein